MPGSGQAGKAAADGYTLRTMMDMSFWPHVWAIPLSILFGIGIGWFVRAQIEDEED